MSVAEADERSWSARLRRRAVAALPPEKLLPDKQPSYVASWIYVFGVLSLSALVVIIASGSILALKGPAWWHLTGVGHFFNSIHLWSVELFFFVMVIHLWGKYWIAAWRGGRETEPGMQAGIIRGSRLEVHSAVFMRPVDRHLAAATRGEAMHVRRPADHEQLRPLGMVSCLMDREDDRIAKTLRDRLGDGPSVSVNRLVHNYRAHCQLLSGAVKRLVANSSMRPRAGAIISGNY